MALADIDLTLRSETGGVPLTTAQHDANLTAIETAVNATNAVVNASGEFVYGEMNQAGNATATSVAASGTYYQVVNFSAGHLDAVTFSSSGLVLPNAGDYLVRASISFSASTGNTCTFAFALDGTVDADHLVERKVSNSDVGACSLVGIVTATAGQTLTLRVKNDAVADVTVRNATVAVDFKH